MSFSEQFTTTCRWRQLTAGDANDGLEHLYVNSCDGNIIASSVVIGEGKSGKFGVHYTLICAADWSVRAFNLQNTLGQTLAMNSDGEGNWFNQDGSEIDHLTGAIDVDFSGTPFTNTLPIRRMNQHTKGNAQRFKMVYVSFDTFEAKIDRQQYTCITPYQKYRYEALGRDFTAEIEVDENGLVLDYPPFFAREAL